MDKGGSRRGLLGITTFPRAPPPGAGGGTDSTIGHLSAAERASQGALSDREPICQCRRSKRHGLDPWVGRSPEEGHDNPPQYSCLERAAVHGVAGSDTTKMT